MGKIAALRAEAFVGAVSPLKRASEAKERAAFRSLALAQKRLSWIYYRWALEAEQAGNLADYRRYRERSDRYRKDAREHLEHARRRNT